MAASTDSEYPWREPASPIARGSFIVVEGLDRTGKTTQVKKLCDRLYEAGHNVMNLRFPDRTSPIGKMIDSYLQSSLEMDDHVIHLLFSANRWEKSKFISSSLSKGYTIICDRYSFSGIIYSAAKHNPSLSLSWAKAPENGLPRPDVVIFLDLEAEEAERRGGYGEEKYEKKEMQERVKEGYLELLGSEFGEKWMRRVDAGKGIEEVGEGIWEQVENVVDAVRKGDRGEEVGILEDW